MPPSERSPSAPSASKTLGRPREAQATYRIFRIVRTQGEDCTLGKTVAYAIDLKVLETLWDWFRPALVAYSPQSLQMKRQSFQGVGESSEMFQNPSEFSFSGFFVLICLANFPLFMVHIILDFHVTMIAIWFQRIN